jgi:hypothetical protein
MHPPETPLSLVDARRLVQGYVAHYNSVRLNGGIGYITRSHDDIHAQRERRLEEARKRRQLRRQKTA